MTTLTTELEAINLMLSVIGESPVSSVTNTGLVDAVLAKQLLDETNREVQTRGWHWNTDKKYKIVPTTSGEIVLPDNTLKVDAVDPTLDVVQRGRKLWDRREHTFQIDKAVEVDIVWMLPFEELPQVARYYITVRAGRKFQDRVVGSETLSGFNSKDEAIAWVQLQDHDASNADYNMIRDSWDVGRIVYRNGQPVWG